jgi:hypothetical protein
MQVQEDAWMGSVVRNVPMILEDIQTVRFASSVFLFLGCIQLSGELKDTSLPFSTPSVKRSFFCHRYCC